MRRRSILAVLTAVLALAMGALSQPPITVACSCVDPAMHVDMLGDDPQLEAFIGRPGPEMPDGVPVAVDAWFGHPAPALVVRLAVLKGDGASCGTGAPAVGRQFLFVLYAGDDGRYAVSLCSLVADLATPDGQAVLARVVAVHGDPISSTLDPPGSDPDTGPGANILPLAIGGVAVVGFAIGVLLIVRRRRDAG
jgi:LPXTG-motif cell wall-anchored protein